MSFIDARVIRALPSIEHPWFMFWTGLFRGGSHVLARSVLTFDCIALFLDPMIWLFSTSSARAMT